MLERGHGLRVEIGLGRRSKRRGDVVGESPHEGADGSALEAAGGGDDGGFDGQGLLRQPRLEPGLELLEASLQLLDWVLLRRELGHHYPRFALLHLQRTWIGLGDGLTEDGVSSLGSGTAGSRLGRG